MVDSEAGDESVVDPADDLTVGVVEHPWFLDPYGRKGVDGEESSVVEVMVGSTPVDQLVVLTIMDGGRVVTGLGAAGREGKRCSW